MRAADVVRASLGTALLARPGAPVRALGVVPTTTSDAAARALGTRWLVQAATGAVAGRRGPAALRTAGGLDAGVELLHAASMVALAAASPRWARPAAASATVATVLAVADLRARRTGGKG